MKTAEEIFKEVDDAIYGNTKPAYMYVFAQHPYCVGYPGICADLFFSSKEKFHELWGDHDLQGDDWALVKVTVPKDFDDWDYIPREY